MLKEENKNKLLQFLETNDISQRDFAELVGISTSSLYEILKKGKKPRVDLAIRIEEKTCRKVSVYDWGDEKI